MRFTRVNIWRLTHLSSCFASSTQFRGCALMMYTLSHTHPRLGRPPLYTSLSDFTSSVPAPLPPNPGPDSGLSSSRISYGTGHGNPIYLDIHREWRDIPLAFRVVRAPSFNHSANLLSSSVIVYPVGRSNVYKFPIPSLMESCGTGDHGHYHAEGPHSPNLSFGWLPFGFHEYLRPRRQHHLCSHVVRYTW